MPRQKRLVADAPATIRAAGYCRVSTSDQAEEGYSLPSQERSIAAYCQAQGWDLVGVYRDEGESGTATDRPALAALLADVRAGKLERIVATKLDRLGRSVRHVLALYDELERAGVGVVLIKEHLDTSTAHGRLFRTIMAAMAEFEREMIAERMQSGRIEKARQGGSLGGHVPLGYRRGEDGRLLIDPDGAAIVQRIFAERAGGATLAKIAEGLRRDGVPTGQGGRWYARTVAYILANPAYTGRPAWNKRKAPVQAEAVSLPILVAEGAA